MLSIEQLSISYGDGLVLRESQQQHQHRNHHRASTQAHDPAVDPHKNPHADENRWIDHAMLL